MARLVIAAVIMAGVAGCVGAESDPVTERQAVKICQDKMAKAHDVVEFADDVTSTDEGGLWDVRGSTEYPPGAAYHCIIVVESGELTIAGFGPE